MPGVFISYSIKDDAIAHFVQLDLTGAGLQALVPPGPILPGLGWSLLKSRLACAARWLHQELGGVRSLQKKIVPKVRDITPSELPARVVASQALDLFSPLPSERQTRLTALANFVMADKRQGLIVVGLIVAGLFAFSAK